MTEVNENVFKKFPVLTTENLVLRKINLNDIKQIYTILSDSNVLKYFGKHPLRNHSEAKERIIQTTEAFMNKEGIRWGITVKKSSLLIGSAGIWRIDRRHMRGELGYELLPEYWGKGIMKEALSAINHFGFNEMKLHTIEANTDPENIASCKLLEGLGFKKEGHLKESFLFDGKFYDNFIYSLVAGKEE